MYLKQNKKFSLIILFINILNKTRKNLSKNLWVKTYIFFN